MSRRFRICMAKGGRESARPSYGRPKLTLNSRGEKIPKTVFRKTLRPQFSYFSLEIESAVFWYIRNTADSRTRLNFENCGRICDSIEKIIEEDLKRWRLAWPRRWFGHNDDIYYVLSEVALTLSGERLKSVTFGHVKDLCFRLPPLHSKWRHHPPILSVSKGPWGLWYL